MLKFVLPSGSFSGRTIAKGFKKQGGEPSRTAGSTKAAHCKATPFQKYCARSSRAYKSKGYHDVCLKWDKLNKL